MCREYCASLCILTPSAMYADASVIAKHQPMVWGTDRLDSSYAAITAKPSYAKPAYVLTFNEPNYAFGGGTPTNIVDPATAASLWPTLMSQYNPLGIGLIAPSAIDCAGDPNCRNTGTAAGWLTAFRDVSHCLQLESHMHKLPSVRL